MPLWKSGYGIRLIVNIAESLRQRLDVALEQQIVQREALKVFSKQQQERVEGWKAMVHEYEENSEKKNPYEAVVSGRTFVFKQDWS
jgi:hypothetical protein